MRQGVIQVVATVLLALAVASCGKKPPVLVPPVEIIKTLRVEVPVPIRVAPPVELLDPAIRVPLPVFVPPSDPTASSALTAEGERRLRVLLQELLTRLDAWRAWATEGLP